MSDHSKNRYTLDEFMSQVLGTSRLSTYTIDRPTASSIVGIMLRVDECLSSTMPDDTNSVSDRTLWLGNTYVDHKELAWPTLVDLCSVALAIIWPGPPTVPALGLATADLARSIWKSVTRLSEVQRKVLFALTEDPMSLESIAASADIDIEQTAASLVVLVGTGLVDQLQDHYHLADNARLPRETYE